MDEKLKREEIENSLLYIKQLNKDLEAKIYKTEQENLTLKNSFKDIDDKIPEMDFLKNKIENLEKELEYKDTLIQYFENLSKENKSKNIFYLYLYYKVNQMNIIIIFKLILGERLVKLLKQMSKIKPQKILKPRVIFMLILLILMILRLERIQENLLLRINQRKLIEKLQEIN